MAQSRNGLISKLAAWHNVDSTRTLFFDRSPDWIATNFMEQVPHPDRDLPLLGSNVYLVHPVLGSARLSHMYELRQNQLDEICRRWKDLCKSITEGQIRTEAAPLLVYGDGCTFVINTDGTYFRVNTEVALIPAS